MPALFYEGPTKTSTLIIFLPGRDDNASAFEKHGFIALLRQKGVSADAISADAHPGYYLNMTLVERLREDVVLPAARRGYTKIWLAGTSMGALGATSYLKRYPKEIRGVFLLGPFFGEKEIVDEIRKSGGLASWAPAEQQSGSWQGKLWLDLRELMARKDLPPVYLGYGKSDRYADGAELFSTLLPPDHVIIVQGGHTWHAWRKAWEIFLERNVIE